MPACRSRPRLPVRSALRRSADSLRHVACRARSGLPVRGERLASSHPPVALHSYARLTAEHAEHAETKRQSRRTRRSRRHEGERGRRLAQPAVARTKTAAATQSRSAGTFVLRRPFPSARARFAGPAARVPPRAQRSLRLNRRLLRVFVRFVIFVVERFVPGSTTGCSRALAPCLAGGAHPGCSPGRCTP